MSLVLDKIRHIQTICDFIFLYLIDFFVIANSIIVRKDYILYNFDLS